MVLKFLNELKANVTEDEFKAVLAIAEEDIKFNQIGFKKLTTARRFIEICMSSLILLQREEDKMWTS